MILLHFTPNKNINIERKNTKKMSSLASYFITPLPGILPKWLLFISAVSVFNSAQCYLSGLELTRRVYENKPLETTGLSARTFGTWTIISAIIRYIAAFHLNDPQIWNLVFASYAIAFGHFMAELVIYKTAKFGKGFMGPFIVSTLSMGWLLYTRDFYLSL
ncbi:Erg28 protein [Saccharomycopsis crataegensis]|uniref:Erg28 protein n=1 Tax=Saccharomycopsis crataegensis TaxID=43959 RepID=A0AAV5QVJ4_9ASCO|nr:Erg28 protein [Saccharomycopsis crataegensis]